MPEENHRWQVDRRIPLATISTLLGLIVAVVIQAGGAFYWAASVNGSLEAFRQRFEATDRRIDAIERQSQIITDQGNKLTAVEVKVQNVSDSLKDLKDIIRERVPAPSHH